MIQERTKFYYCFVQSNLRLHSKEEVLKESKIRSKHMLNVEKLRNAYFTKILGVPFYLLQLKIRKKKITSNLLDGKK